MNMKEQIITFIKSPLQSIWYAEIPNYPGPHEDLEMVDSAGTFLSQLDNGLGIVQVSISDEPDGLVDVILEKTAETQDEKGANYNIASCYNYVDSIWLCGVLEFVFGSFPDHLYLEILPIQECRDITEEAFFKAGRHHQLHEDRVNREWNLLSKTNKWRFWHFLAAWADYANERKMGWMPGDRQMFQFESFRYFMPENKLNECLTFPELYISTTKNFPYQFPIVVNHENIQELQAFIQDYFKNEVPFVEVYSYLDVAWSKLKIPDADVYIEDVVEKAFQITQWDYNEIDLWRRVVGKKDKWSKALLYGNLNTQQKDQMETLENIIHQTPPSINEKVWWELHEKMKKQ